MPHDTDWTRLIRHAFGVPDVVAAEGANEMIARTLLSEDLPAPIPFTTDIDNMTNEILVRCHRGALDGLFTGSPRFDIGEEAQGICRVVKLTSAAAPIVAESYLRAIGGFVAAFPFVDDAGRYYRY